MNQYIEAYCVEQNKNGLKGPLNQKLNRLFFSMKFFVEKEKFFIHEKVYFLSEKEALKQEDFTETIENNLNYIKNKLNRNLPFFIIPKRKKAPNLDWIFTRQHLKHSLESLLNSKMELFENYKIWIITQILLSVSILHNLDIPHCDLAPSNVLLTSDHLVYLTDFGIVNPHFYLNQDLDKINLFNSKIDDQCFLAPELFIDDGKTEILNYNDPENKIKIEILKGADVFSIGCIIYMVLTDGKILLDHRKLKELKKSNDFEKFLEEDLKLIKNKEMKNFLLKLINIDKDKRINIFDAIKEWNDIIYQKDEYFIYYINYLLRHPKLSYMDHKLFLVTCATNFFKEKKIYGFEKLENTKYSMFSNFNFRRLSEIVKEINSENFKDILSNIFKESNKEQLNQLIIDFENYIENFIQKISIKEIKKPDLKTTIEKQNESKPEKYKKRSLNLKERQKNLFNNILSHKDYRIEKNALNYVSSILIKFISNNLNYANGSETKSLTLDTIRILSQRMTQIEIIVFLIPRFIFSLSEDKYISKIKLLRTISKVIQNIKFIEDKRFCKQHSVENYIYTLVEKILNSSNTILHMEFTNNLHNFMHLNYVFAISYSYNKDSVNDYKSLLNNKTFLLDIFKTKQFFVQWIKKLLETLEYKQLVLKELPYLIHFLDENVLFKHIDSLVINFTNFQDSKIYAIQLVPYLFVSQPQNLRNFFPIISENMKLDNNEDVLIACVLAIRDILDNFLYEDIYFFKLIANDLFKLYNKNTSEIVLETLKDTFCILFSKFSEDIINTHFSEIIEKLSGSELDTMKNLEKEEINRIIDCLKVKVIKEDNKIIRKATNFQYESFFKRNYSERVSDFFSKQKSKNIIDEFHKFIFSLYFFDVNENISKKDSKAFYNFETLLNNITNNISKKNDKKVKDSIFDEKDNNWNFNKKPEKMDFSEILKLKELLIEKIKKAGEDLNQIYNREIFYSVFYFFEEFIKNFNLKNFYFEIKNEKIINTVSLRQIQPKGNLVSTIYGAKGAIKSLSKGYKDIFLAGTSKGEVITYNLDNLKKNVPTLLHQKYVFNNKDNILKVLAFENDPKALVVTKNGKIYNYDIEKNTLISKWTTDDEISDVSLMDPTLSSISDSFIVSEISGNISVFDIRKPERCNSIKMGALLGIPKTLAGTKMFNQTYIGTLRGFLTRYDLRKNLFGECFQLYRKNKVLPIYTASEFIPSTEFQNFEMDQDYLVLSYPSKKNEFSIFNLGSEQNFYNENRLPKLHFYSDLSDDQSGEIVEIPYLVLHDEQSIMNIKRDYQYNSSTILNKLSMKDDIFKSRPENYLKCLDHHLKSLINKNKISKLNNLTSDKDIFFKLEKYTKSLRKIISLPNYHTLLNSKKIELDNILFTCGDERNIRFINFGNTFKIQKPLLRNSGNLRCYHLSNSDLIERSFNFYYTGDVCVIKEQAGKSINKKKKIEKIENAFGVIRNFDDGIHDNGLSDIQNYNFGNKFNLKKKAFGKSLATPSHSHSINDIFLQNYDKKFYIISGSEDGLIKIWN